MNSLCTETCLNCYLNLELEPQDCMLACHACGGASEPAALAPDNMIVVLQLQQKASSLTKTVQQLQQKLATVIAEVQAFPCFPPMS